MKAAKVSVKKEREERPVAKALFTAKGTIPIHVHVSTFITSEAMRFFLDMGYRIWDTFPRLP